MLVRAAEIGIRVGASGTAAEFPSDPRVSPEYCTYCPKMCRFSCPVSTAEARETVTPWGKQTILHEVWRGTLALDESSAKVFWACMECHACRTFCYHRIDVPASLRVGRAMALRGGSAPAAARAIQAGFAERERLARDSVSAPAAARRVAAGVKTALFAGCKPCIDTPGDVETAARILDVGSGDTAAIVAEYCCGLPLLQAGDEDGFAHAARRLARALSGIQTVVVWDPGCLHAMKTLYAERGITVDATLVHISEWVVSALGRFRPVDFGAPAYYHDPCHLGRDLGVYDAPRDVLSRVLVHGIREFDRHHDEAECCGGGGAVPATAPDTTRAAARRRLEQTDRSAPEGTIVTAYPTCRSTLAAEEPKWSVRDIVEVLGDALIRP